MNDRYRQVLTKLRCEINLIRDSPVPSTREVVTRMLAFIETELSLPAQISKSEPADLARMPSATLLREIGRRITANRHVRKLCDRCKNKAARARGLCVTCYKKAYRRGEINTVQSHRYTPSGRKGGPFLPKEISDIDDWLKGKKN